MTKTKALSLNERISKCVEKKSKGIITNLGDSIEIIDSKTGTCYQFDSYIRYCRRQFKHNCIKPYEGERISTYAHVPDLWKISTEGTNKNEEDDVEPNSYDLTDLKRIYKRRFKNIQIAKEDIFEENCNEYPVDGSFEISSCSECNGCGDVVCPSCKGNGYFLCRSCNGKGYKTRTDYHDRRYKSRSNCFWCNGTGKTLCGTCEGKTRLICSTCEGRGKVLCYTKLQEHFTYDDDSFFSTDVIPENLVNEFSAEAEFEKIDEFDANSSDYAEKLEQLGLNKKELVNSIGEKIELAHQNLDENQKVDKILVSIYKTEVVYVRYKYENNEYSLILYGAEGIFIPEEENGFTGKIRKILKYGVSEKKKVITLLLCIFLGLPGIHRFYAGKIYSGLFLLCLNSINMGIASIVLYRFFMFHKRPSHLLLEWCCTGVIWVLIDLVCILAGQFKCKENKLILK